MLSFTTNGAANYQISFKNNGGDNVGALLDNVNVSTGVSEVPVPAALPLMASALGIFGLSRRRKS